MKMYNIFDITRSHWKSVREEKEILGEISSYIFSLLVSIFLCTIIKISNQTFQSLITSQSIFLGLSISALFFCVTNSFTRILNFPEGNGETLSLDKRQLSKRLNKLNKTIVAHLSYFTLISILSILILVGASFEGKFSDFGHINQYKSEIKTLLSWSKKCFEIGGVAMFLVSLFLILKIQQKMNFLFTFRSDLRE